MIKRKFSLKFLLYGSVAFFLLWVILMVFSNRILTKNHPINAKILVIEGWLSACDLEIIPKKIDLNKYEKIFVTGTVRNYPDYLVNNPETKEREMPVRLIRKGCLCISKATLEKINFKDSILEIQVFAYGSEACGRFPNFFVGINDSIIGNAFVNEKLSQYVFYSKMALSDLRGIYIYFNNDLKLDGADRNLTIDSISINKTVLNKPSDFYKIYDVQLNGNLYFNYPFRSNAVLTTYYLKALGVKNNIITVDTFFKRNKTLAAARRLQIYLRDHYNNLEAINVVSIDGHSRRSYLAYKIAFLNKRPIGIISLNDITMTSQAQTKKWLYRMLNEYIKLFVTAIEYVFS